MKFLANKETNNHLKVFSENLELHEEAYFAVAFLKASGINQTHHYS
jgi:hypothetical protein